MQLLVIVIQLGWLILHLDPVTKEIWQGLRLDSISSLIKRGVRRYFYCPLGNPASLIFAPDDFRNWSFAYHGDRMLLEIMFQLLDRQIYTICHLLDRKSVV